MEAKFGLVTASDPVRYMRVISGVGGAFICYRSGNLCPVAPLDGKQFTLGELQVIMGGDVAIQQMRDSRFLISSEDADMLNSSLNPLATLLAHYPQCGWFLALYGDALICGGDQIEHHEEE